MCQYVNMTASADKAIALITMPLDERRTDATNLCKILHF